MTTREANHRERLEAAIKTLNDDPALSAAGFRETIRAEVDEGDPSLHRTGPLPLLAMKRAEATGTQDLELMGLLGEGGMGVVHLARQRSLGREVAIKTLKPGVRSHKAPLSLLREAILTGGLEHPNVIPIHALGLDEGGLPMLVMKRVEGVRWGDLIADPARIGDAAVEPLLYHLSVLAQVCNAVHFAHARGVIHLDLKPDNIMIGRYGEVYLMDWGIAQELGRAPGGGEPGGIVGTPAYMAPEMTFGDPSRLSERTDVYLIGAILHEILTGSPPHTGPSIFTVLLKVAESAPRQFGLEVPAELAAICNKAMSADPQARYEDAQALQRALSRFVQHRDSFRLGAQAQVHLKALQGLLAASVRDDDVDRAFGACRFGFLQALDIWPGNEEARAGLAQALRAMIEHELEAGNPRTAATLLVELPEADPDLSARVEALRKVKEAREQELERLRQLADSPAAMRQRQLFALIAVFPLTLGPMTAAALKAWFGFEITAELLFKGTSIVALLVGAMIALSWRKMAPHPVNRTLIKTLIVLIGALWSHRALVMIAGADIHQMFMSELVMITAGLTAVALAVDLALLWGLPIYGAAMVVALLWPEGIVGTIGLSNLLIFTMVSMTWRRRALSSAPQEAPSGPAPWR